MMERMGRERTTRTPAAPSESERLITTRELSTRTTLSRSTIWRLVRDRQIPAPLKLTTSRIAWREGDITAWLAERAEAGRQ